MSAPILYTSAVRYPLFKSCQLSKRLRHVEIELFCNIKLQRCTHLCVCRSRRKSWSHNGVVFDFLILEDTVHILTCTAVFIALSSKTRQMSSVAAVCEP